MDTALPVSAFGAYPDSITGFGNGHAESDADADADADPVDAADWFAALSRASTGSNGRLSRHFGPWIHDWHWSWAATMAATAAAEPNSSVVSACGHHG